MCTTAVTLPEECHADERFAVKELGMSGYAEVAALIHNDLRQAWKNSKRCRFAAASYSVVANMTDAHLAYQRLSSEMWLPRDRVFIRGPLREMVVSVVAAFDSLAHAWAAAFWEKGLKERLHFNDWVVEWARGKTGKAKLPGGTPQRDAARLAMSGVAHAADAADWPLLYELRNRTVHVHVPFLFVTIPAGEWILMSPKKDPNRQAIVFFSGEQEQGYPKNRDDLFLPNPIMDYLGPMHRAMAVVLNQALASLAVEVSKSI